jgi:hypothetical protein
MHKMIILVATRLEKNRMLLLQNRTKFSLDPKTTHLKNIMSSLYLRGVKVTCTAALKIKLLPASFAVFTTYQYTQLPRGRYGPFSLCVH